MKRNPSSPKSLLPFGKVVFVQNGFISEVGHWMHEMRSWRNAVLNEGMAWHGLANTRLPKTIAEREDVDPCIPYLPGQTLRGWHPVQRLSAFADGMEQWPSLLSKHYPGTPESSDLLYVAYATDVEIIGVAAWLESLSPACRPAVAFTFHHPSHEWKANAEGTGITGDAHRWIYAMQRLKATAVRVRYFATVPGLAKALTQFLNTEVETLPFASTMPGMSMLEESHAKKHDVGFFSVRKEQGIELLPGILQELNQRMPGLRVFLQPPPGKARTMLESAIDSRMKNLRVTLTAESRQPIENFGTSIAECRTICFPYLRTMYCLRSSGIFNEANMIGTPCIVPEGTPMGRMVSEGLASGIVYGRENPLDIANAVMAALACEKDLKARAEQLTERWKKSHDGSNIIRLLIQSFSKK